MKTIKLLTLALSLTSAFLISEAQGAQQNSWTIAPSLGYASFKLKSDSMNMDSKGNVSAGVQVYKHLSQKVDLETGLQYFQAGGKLGDDSGVEFNLDYLSIPLGARWRFYNYGNNESKYLYLKGGVAAAYLMSAKAKVSIWGMTGEDGEGEQDIKDDFNSVDLFAYAGLGGTYAISDVQNLIYEFSYLQGTQKVMKEEKSHSEGWAFNLMYSIAI